MTVTQTERKCATLRTQVQNKGKQQKITQECGKKVNIYIYDIIYK